MTHPVVARPGVPDGQPLYRIVYLSRAVRPLDRAELFDLCEVSRRHNAGRGLTGLLLHDGERFIQALEGPDNAVRPLMYRIERDPRHYSISYMVDQRVQKREFGDWSMAARHADDFDTAAAFLDHVKDDMAALDDVRLCAAFIGFASMGWRQRHPHAG